jgi:putative glutamine amidotransferase
MRPRIGITSAPIVYEDRPSEHVERAYVDAVGAGGGLPIVLPVLEPADAGEVLGALDGLVLSGGGDVDPSRYGEPPAPETYGVRPDRDAWELALVAAAQAVGLPLLGVCRGLQVLNVGSGGSLVQHLPQVTQLSHKEYERDREEVHILNVAPDSLVGRIAGVMSFGANSLHHQAVARIGHDLRAVAWAADGTVEALESADGLPVVAVQWHPELLAPAPPHGDFFRWVAQAATAQRSRPPL